MGHLGPPGQRVVVSTADRDFVEDRRGVSPRDAAYQGGRRMVALFSRTAAGEIDEAEAYVKNLVQQKCYVTRCLLS